MTSTFDQVLAVLTKRISMIHARSILSRTVEACGLEPEQLDPDRLPEVVARVQTLAAIFVTEDDRAGLREDLGELVPGVEGRIVAQRHEVRTPADVGPIRTRARELCILLGGTPAAVQKAATITGELARNIAAYTPGGWVELRPVRSPPSLTIVARDQGPGIDNLDAVLDGTYESPTGLGMGLVGSQRLADDFSIDTGPNGTRIEARLRL